MKTDPGLLERLKIVATRHTQSEIARRTGTGVSNVHHYLNGTRVPADFCIALVRELGVSAQWLLTGEGEPYTADAAPDADQFAGDVKRLSRALDAASRLRLGELFHGKRTRALAEINDALDTHAEAQRRVNAQVRQPLIDIYDSCRAAIDEHDHGKPEALGRAISLLRSGHLLLRLTDDPARALEVVFMETQLAIRESRFADALDGARRCFLMSFSVLGPAAPRFIDAASAYASGAWRLGYMREARAILDAGLAMARMAGNDPDFSGFDDVLRASLAAETGTIDGMYSLAQHGLARLANVRLVAQINASPLVAKIGMMAGVTTFEEALKAEPRSTYQLRHLFQWAAWLEDAGRLRKLLRVNTKDMAGVSSVSTRLYDHWRAVGKFVLRAGWDRPSGLWREYEAWDKQEVSSGAPEKDAVQRKIRCTQIARLCGEIMPAGKLLIESDRLLKGLPTGMDAYLLDRATHYRNALVLGDHGKAGAATKQLRDDARRWFFDMTANGYACFAGLGL